MTGPFTGLAQAYSRGTAGADEIERRRKQEEDAAIQQQIQRMAMMNALAKDGISSERETMDIPIPSSGKNGVTRIARTGLVDPSRYQSVGKIGGTEMFRDKARAIAAQRAAEREAELRERATIAGIYKTEAETAKLGRPEEADAISWQTVEGADGFYQVNPKTGETRRVEGVRPKPPTPTTNQDRSAAAALRGQFNGEQTVKDAGAVATAYQKIRQAASKPSAAGDLSLIFGYMRMLDPGSTVREGEFANAQNAAGVPDQIRNMYNRATRGERLNPAQRQDFLKQAEGIARAQQQSLYGVMGRYVDIAKRNGMNPRDIVFDPFESASKGLPFPEY